ncbi:GntR family transcriptional regulator [Salimicrobium halophilum]|uniref:DNA-binding transcriptional regulator, GntR family n=1 Tax=Salimicrobium halophilum TaxID=86666 RepID=A0A1G8R1V1_9BACI|nr:GntR family transcriptional regulator [Salimicrobium halophilum]SDJ10390.1 DNA-binding transcriptional regulator, GntR family [Salimicrobium halophilum]
MQKINTNVSLADQAYESLRQSIVQGELHADEELREENIAKQLGVSRTPLRDALRRLAMDGLVVLRKGKPAKVATFTMEDSLHLIEVRSLLEIHNIVTITPHITEERVQQLRENLFAQKNAIKDEDYESFVELDREFHLLLTEDNPNTKLQELIHQMNSGDYRAFIILSNTLSPSAEVAYGEHHHILEAIENRDTEKAKETMEHHMANIRKRLTQSN